MISPWHHPARKFTALSVLAALVVAGAAAPALADPDTQVVTTAGALTPDQDPFYRPPADIASYAAGRVVASREVTPEIGPLPVPVRAWQLSYRSNDQDGQPILAVTTLLSPAADWRKRGSRPIVSYQAFEDSVGSRCAPSYNIASGNAGELGTGSMVKPDRIAPYLQAGWALAIPEHEGPQAYFGVGRESGRITLDGIRAVQSFTGDRSIGADSPVAMSGYSGGAQATGWAAQLQPAYAPEVKLAGAAVGGMPADLTTVAQFIDGGPFAGFEFAVADSLARAYPSAGIPALLNARGVRDFQAIKGLCQDAILTTFAFRTLSHDATVAEPLAVPAVANALTINKLGVAAAPQTPIYDYHVDTDEVVPVGQDNATVQLWRARGATVDLVRDVTGGHVGEYAKRLPSTVAFLQDRFDGKPFAAG
ncbi:MAG: lipase family protein [Mycobacterium sp.]|uniref:lipase family protein n=1 Tax=Mycobacterium sp. TaxID=1785 RepID=UPI003CC622EE